MPGRKSTMSEVKARRERLVQMRLMKMTEAQMADAVGVSEGQVSRDLNAMRETWREQYGVTNFDPAVAVAEAIENFNFCEARSLREYLTLDRAQETGAEHIHRALQQVMPELVATARSGIVEAVKERLNKVADQITQIARGDKAKQRTMTYAKLRCLQQAREAAQSRMDLLQDFGLVSRLAPGSSAEERGDARRIKEWMDSVQVSDETLRSDAEKAWLAEKTGTVQ